MKRKLMCYNIDMDNVFTNAVYTVSQVATTCGVSRSTLLRLEDEGLLIPSIHDAAGTKRMYSFLDIMKLREIITLHSYGFTYSIIKEYFEDNGNCTNLIALLAAKQSDIFYFLHEMEERMGTNTNLDVEYVYFPETPIYCNTMHREFPRYDVHKSLIYKQMEEVVAKKYKVSTGRPLFLTTPWEDIAEGADFYAPRDFTGCIPLAEMPSAPDKHVILDPSRRVLSILIHGPSIPMDAVIAKLKEKVETNNLKVNGPLHLVSMVGPHLGLDIPPERYLARIALPVEEE